MLSSLCTLTSVLSGGELRTGGLARPFPPRLPSSLCNNNGWRSVIFDLRFAGSASCKSAKRAKYTSYFQWTVMSSWVSVRVRMSVWVRMCFWESKLCVHAATAVFKLNGKTMPSRFCVWRFSADSVYRRELKVGQRTQIKIRKCRRAVGRTPGVENFACAIVSNDMIKPWTWTWLCGTRFSTCKRESTLFI